MNVYSLWLLISFIFISAATPSEVQWRYIAETVGGAIEQRLFPGCSIALISEGEIIYTLNSGTIEFENKIGIDNYTQFDLDSLTSLLATNAAAISLIEDNHLAFDTPSSCCTNRVVTVLDLLSRCAEFSSILNFYQPNFPCPENQKASPQLNFSFPCREAIYEEIHKLNITTVGTTTDKSDISSNLLMNLIGKTVKEAELVHIEDLNTACTQNVPSNHSVIYQCYYEAYIRKMIGSETAIFLPSNYTSIPPSTNDTIYRHRLIQGEVLDKNAFVMGGISGHAGLFGTINDAIELTSFWMKSFQEGILNVTSEGFGWEKDLLECSPYEDSKFKTWGHLSLTGSIICMDPHRQTVVVLLTGGNYQTEYTITEEYRQFLRKFSQLAKHLLHEYRLPPVNTHTGTNTFIVSILFSLIVICFLCIYKIVMFVKSRNNYAVVDAKKNDIKALFEANDEDILEIPQIDENEEKLHDKFNKYVHNRGRSSSELKQRVVQVGVGSDDEWSEEKSD